MRAFIGAVSWVMLLGCMFSSPAHGGAQQGNLLLLDGFEAIPNRPPIAHAGSDASVTVGKPYPLNGTQSVDPDGDPISYQWKIVQRPPSSGAQVFEPESPTPVFIPDRAGQYVLRLVVSDKEFNSIPAEVTLDASGALVESAMIGSSGGAVGLPDGASVLLPPGALAVPTQISIAEIALPPGSELPSTAVVVGGVYAFHPDGQGFQTPVQIVVPYDPALLPPGYSEGAISIYRRESWPQFDMVGSDDGEESISSNGQVLDPARRLVSVSTSMFSAYAALAVNGSSQFTATPLAEQGASVVVRRPPLLRSQRATFHHCTAPGNVPNRGQTNLATRPAANIAAIVLHSTNNGNATRSFEGELGWAADDCNGFFAHYYINRDGAIYQVADDLAQARHTASSASLGVGNNNSIGIEIFNNVGEPFDGRQLSAVIRLVDFLMVKYSLPRPGRDPARGILQRNRASIGGGGDRVLGHIDVDPNKCDPVGTFMDSGFIKPESAGLNCSAVLPIPLPGGNSAAPALMDIVLDAVAVLDRTAQHTGIINTHGGDAYELAVAGDGGDISLTEDAVAVANRIGSTEQALAADNLPLIVAAGSQINLVGPGPHVYSDVVIAGTAMVEGATEFHVTGTFYVSPTGKVIARTGHTGADVTVYSRGAPIIQGLLDARGDDGNAGTPNGGSGGEVKFIYAAPAMLLAPTLYTRGGDADRADISAPGGGPAGGDGGDVAFTMVDSHVFLGGGVGPVVSNETVPPWRSGSIDPASISAPGRWAGDYLPPPPPFNRSSIGVNPPAADERVRLWTSGAQLGFAHGIVTTGGMGGAGIGSSDANKPGGTAGSGGNVQINLGAGGLLTLRNVDFVTGGELETLTHRFFLPPPAAPTQRLVCTASGAQGGFGTNFGGSGGHGGPGGAAGSISIAGGTLVPAPASFATRYDIRGFPPGQRLQDADDGCSRGSVVVGNIIEASDANAQPLYRLRLDAGGTALLGGLGGIPSGRSTAGYPGNVGAYGDSAPISGLPVQ